MYSSTHMELRGKDRLVPMGRRRSAPSISLNSSHNTHYLLTSRGTHAPYCTHTAHTTATIAPTPSALGPPDPLPPPPSPHPPPTPLKISTHGAPSPPHPHPPHPPPPPHPLAPPPYHPPDTPPPPIAPHLTRRTAPYDPRDHRPRTLLLQTLCKQICQIPPS